MHHPGHKATTQPPTEPRPGTQCGDASPSGRHTCSLPAGKHTHHASANGAKWGPYSIDPVSLTNEVDHG